MKARQGAPRPVVRAGLAIVNGIDRQWEGRGW
jgi:hypothetical protein